MLSIKNRLLALTGLAAVAVCVLASAPTQAGDKMDKDIVETAVAAGKFKTLTKLLKDADLVDTLKGKGPFTVFAPTDEAFEKIADKLGTLDKETVKKVLLSHVVVGKAVKSADAPKYDSKDINGYPVEVKGGKVSIGKATVVKADIIASNGVIHVIDEVLVPTKGKKND